MAGRLRPDEIAASLRRAVRERVLAPGEALNQDELARRYGVSRIPLREALRTLVGEGLVVMQPGLGAVVTQLDAADVAQLYGLRLALEPPLSPFVVARAGRQDADRLAGIVTAMADLAPERSEQWSNLNYGFHRALYELSEQRHVVRLAVQVLNLVEPYARVHAHVLGARGAMQQQRATIVAALRAGDPVRLERVLTESIVRARDELLGSMSDASPDGSSSHDPLAISD